MKQPIAPVIPAAETTPPSTAGADGEQPIPERITLEELHDLQQSGEPVLLLDVRTQRTYETDPFIARGAVRMPPDDAVRLATAMSIPWKATLVAYCA